MLIQDRSHYSYCEKMLSSLLLSPIEPIVVQCSFFNQYLVPITLYSVRLLCTFDVSTRNDCSATAHDSLVNGTLTANRQVDSCDPSPAACDQKQSSFTCSSVPVLCVGPQKQVEVSSVVRIVYES